MNTSTTGICHIVGAGPGDEGLITVRGLACVREADVILYDYLCNPRLLRFARPEARRIFVGKNSEPKITQEMINAMILEETRAGRTVCRLKGGDPYVFGRGGEEALVLREAGLPFEVVPGISSSVAVPAYAGIPLTHRHMTSSFAVITGHEDPTKPDRGVDWKKVAEYPGTKVILMGVGKIDEIARRLVAHGLAPETPVAVISWGTYARQRTVTAPLGQIGAKVVEAGLEAPAVTVVGEVVGLRDSLNWFETRPLFGKRIVITRTREQAGTLSARLTALGAEVLELPVIRITRQTVELPADLGKNPLGPYDWILFTSPNAVEHFVAQILEKSGDIRALGTSLLAAIGPATARALRQYHLKVAFEPTEHTSEKFAAQFVRDRDLRGARILWPCGNLAGREWIRTLESQGAEVETLTVYRTTPETEDWTGARADLIRRGADWIVFASRSAAQNFAALRLPLAGFNMRHASIGPETTRAMKAAGMGVDVEAAEHTLEGIVQALQQQG
ncbi:MAG: uroporphyrinogen-III C-methyltransferase [Verrucomicrobiae bacterium]|nr:uroporphyrinogen-III C-methyltransferase [Verrucomicrobiae bacterium]